MFMKSEKVKNPAGYSSLRFLIIFRFLFLIGEHRLNDFYRQFQGSFQNTKYAGSDCGGR
jgi:hypothetical protein